MYIVLFHGGFVWGFFLINKKFLSLNTFYHSDFRLLFFGKKRDISLEKNVPKT